MNSIDAKTAAVLTMLSREKPGAIVRVKQSELSHAIACAKLLENGIEVVSFDDFDKAILLKKSKDCWVLAYPTQGYVYAGWIDFYVDDEEERAADFDDDYDCENTDDPKEKKRFTIVSREELLESEESLILVWDFRYTPAHLAYGLSGGDEDWTALLPPGPHFEDDYFWLNSGYFGSCSVDEIELSDWHSIAVGSHS